MLPARDRLTKLYIYTSEADMLADTNGTEYTQGVVDGSQRFEHTFFSAFPSFGEANAAMYECEIAGTGDLTGKYIRVKYCYYATSSTSTRTERWLFAGKVDKCTYDRNKTARSVTAYDKLYELRTVDISAWWTTYWAAQSANRTYAQFLTDMCAEFGVQTDWGNLYDASASIVYTAAQNIKLSGCSFVDMLHYIGQLSRYSFFMRENGKLGRSYMHNNISQTNIDSVIDATETEYGDEPLAAYAAVMAYDGADVIYTHGSGSLTWTIRDNPLLKGKTTAQIATELDALLPKLAVTAGYYPLDAEVVVSSPDVLNISYDNLTNIRTTDGNLVRKHVIGSIELWGSQLINQRIICPSEMEQGDSLSPSMSAALSEIQKMGVEMTFKVNSDAVIEAVNMEASDTVKINAQAINLNGAVTANQNFKILLDGSMETIAGKLGGWLIDSNRLYKTYNGETIELSSNEYAFGISTSDANNNYVWIRPSGLTTEHKLQGYSDVATGYTNLQGNEIEQATEVWEAHAEWSDYVERTHAQMKDGKLILEKRTPDSQGKYFDRPWITTEISPDALKIGGKDILRTHQSLVGGWFLTGTITSNSDLNTGAYCKVGRWSCSTAVANTLRNTPVYTEFVMTVRVATQTGDLGDESGTWTYRIREIETWNGIKYRQQCDIQGTAGAWNFGEWEPDFGYSLKALVGRQSSIDNLARNYANSRVHVRLDIVSSTTSPNPFSGDGYVLTFFWDTAEKWDTQVYFPSGGGTPAIRKRRNNTSWDTQTYFVMDEVSKSTYSNTSMKEGNLIARRQGHVVTLHSGGNATSIQGGDWRLYVTVDAKYRPSETVAFPIANVGTGISAWGRVDTSGRVYLYTATTITSSRNFAFSATYIVD